VISTLVTTLRGFVSKTIEERGQDLVEYAVLVGGIGLAVGVLLFAFDFSSAVSDFTVTIADCIQFNTGGCNF
jgi:hypothetical protein